MSQSVDGGDEDASVEGRHDVQVARLVLALEGECGDRPVN
jgi:hypothetical protein